MTEQEFDILMHKPGAYLEVQRVGPTIIYGRVRWAYEPIMEKPEDKVPGHVPLAMVRRLVKRLRREFLIEHVCWVGDVARTRGEYRLPGARS